MPDQRPAQRQVRGDDPLENCRYAVAPGHPPAPLALMKHERLHPDGYRLITSWFGRAYEQRNDDEAVFEAFIFAWMSVNAWAACVTGRDDDRDSEYMWRLQRDRGLQQRFADLLRANPTFLADVTAFRDLLPIFRAQSIRHKDVRFPAELSDRSAVIRHYLNAGITDFKPECVEWHRNQGEEVPLDWPHTLAAIYRVRCNLFHGEKSMHSEMDTRIVRAAFKALIGFFRGAGIL